MSKVMIVIPVHNGAGMIERTLESCLAQTHRCNIVVVDNMSDDNTKQVVSDCINKAVLSSALTFQYISNPHNLGRVGNWNKALEIFKGSSSEYCKLMFVGDTIEPDCIEKQLKHMTDSTKMVSCAHRVLKKNNRGYIMNHAANYSKQNIDINFTPEESLAFSLRNGNWFAGTMGCMLFHKDVVHTTEFNLNLDWAGDWKFWAELAVKTNMVYLNDALATFDMTARKGYKRMAGTVEAMNEEVAIKKFVAHLYNNIIHEKAK